MSARAYVVGFMLNAKRDAVVLVRKNRPAWQAGRLNGVGGKVEPGETLPEAMAREFEEEAGYRTTPDSWSEICRIEWPDDVARVGDAEPTAVTFFRHVSDADPNTFRFRLRSRTDEAIEIWSVDVACVRAKALLIPNLRWLLPLAAYTADRYEPFVLHASVAETICGPSAGAA